ncbi:MAG: AmmeMemoRadiSam system protein B [Desulfomonilaceae bacterium]
MNAPRYAGVWLCVVVLVAVSDTGNAEEFFPALFPKKGVFLAAIEKATRAPVQQTITGITVPHHLLAADLIAETFHMASGSGPTRIIILSPDHFRRSQTPFAVARKGFRTPFGPVRSDEEAVEELLSNHLVSESNLFSHEHGVQAMLPFITYYFPEARVIAVAIHIMSKPEEWNSFVRTLSRIVTRDTLIVQSTDFSHYMSFPEARKKDQETLRVLSMADPGLVKHLTQPDHLDSAAAQYIQLCVQREIFHSWPTVTCNRNSQDYSDKPVQKTTSYITQVYSPDRLKVPVRDRYFFAGDTFCGRRMARVLADDQRFSDLVRQVSTITGGGKLIVNLEGVMMDQCPDHVGRYQLCMETTVTLRLLRELNVIAVSLANNHAGDFGSHAYDDMRHLLQRSGITVLERGSLTDLGPFRIAALTDVDNSGERRTSVLQDSDLQFLVQAATDKPLFAFLHWGSEYSRRPALRESILDSELGSKGVEVLIGCHSHRASDLHCDSRRCGVFSLGNFVFDQSDPRISGKILEIDFFPQGTYFLRIHELGNMYSGLYKHKKSD